MKNRRADIVDRQKKMERFINSTGYADVNDLVQKFGVSAVTVRRDLDQLASDQRIARTFGGAKQLETSGGSAPISALNLTDPNPKLARIQRDLAKAAAEQIIDNDTVFINSSRTASYVVEYLGDKLVTIVTNNIVILARSHSRYNTLIMTGGQTRPKSAALTGAYAIDALSGIVATKSILGVRGINASTGITSSVLEESYINQKMIQQTNGSVIVVADHRKIGRKDSFICGSIHDVNMLITNEDAGSHELGEIAQQGVQVSTIQIDLGAL